MYATTPTLSVQSATVVRRPRHRGMLPIQTGYREQCAVSIVLADDHALLRESVAQALSTEAGFSIVGSVASAEEAATLCLRMNPDVLMMDIDMPGQSSFEVAATVLKLCSATRILFLSAFNHDRYIERALAVEASAYVTKSESMETLIKAIHAVASGRCYYSAEVSARIVIDTGRAYMAKPSRTRTSTLTSREREVLGCIARGMPKKQIAWLIHVSVKTVDRHATNLMAKLNIHDRVELTRFAIREGLVGISEMPAHTLSCDAYWQSSE